MQPLKKVKLFDQSHPKYREEVVLLSAVLEDIQFFQPSPFPSFHLVHRLRLDVEMTKFSKFAIGILTYYY